MPTLRHNRHSCLVSRWLILMLLLNTAAAGAMGLEKAEVIQTGSIGSSMSCHEPADDGDANDDSSIGCYNSCAQCPASMPALHADFPVDAPMARYSTADKASLLTGYAIPLYKPPRN